jgi:uncharacterized protein YjbI with pentapeptide repeats
MSDTQNTPNFDEMSKAARIEFLSTNGTPNKIAIWNAWKRRQNRYPRLDLSDAVLRGADLRGADLRGADLRDAALSDAALSGADLSGAVLRGADLRDAALSDAALSGAVLRGAVLRDAVLRGAVLRDAALSDADLSGAVLRDAVLRDAEINWQSHHLLSEILMRAAGDDIEKNMVAGLVRLRTDWCWEKWVKIEHSQRDWALAELAKWVKDGDGAPAIMRRLAEKIAAESAE